MATEFQKSRLEAITNPKALRKRLDRARTKRLEMEPLIEEALRLYLPQRRTFYTFDPGQDRAADIYDETGTNALMEFASRLHSGLTPNFAKFALLEAGPSVDPNDRDAVNRDLEEITDYLFEEVWASNFSQEISEAYLDAAISVGNLLVDPGQGESLMTHTALPMTDLYLEAGPKDEIGGVFRERPVRADMIEVLYPKAKISETLKSKINNEQDCEFKVIDCILTDHTASFEACIIATFIDDENETIQAERHEGRGCNPFIGFRMGKITGEVWGRGPALNTLPAVRTLNATFELILQYAAMAMVPMYHVDDDSIINPDTITIEPGAILPRMAGSRGLEPIDSGSKPLNLEQIVIDNMSLKIRRGLFNDMLSDPNKTPASAFEVAERMGDLANRLASGFGRLHYELVLRYMMRLVYLGKKAGKIELPKIRGEEVSVRATSPLALAQGQRDVQNLINYHQISTALMGPQASAAQYDEEQLFNYLRGRLGTPEMIFLATEEARKRFAGLMTAQMAGMQTGGAPAAPISPNQ